MLQRLVIAATLATACQSAAPPPAPAPPASPASRHTAAPTDAATPTDVAGSPGAACPVAPAAGDVCTVHSPCDYDGRVRCHCRHDSDRCPGGVPPQVDPDAPRRWVCGERPHPTCEATTTFTGACTDEGRRCVPACYVVATCTGGQWQVQELSPPP